MDTYINIVSLALSVGGLIPIFLATKNPNQNRRKVILAIILVTIFSLSAISLWNDITYQSQVAQTKQEIMATLGNNKKTFEQVYDDMYYPGFALANDALDQLVSENQVAHEKIAVKSPNGEDYEIRIYYVPSTSSPIR